MANEANPAKEAAEKAAQDRKIADQVAKEQQAAIEKQAEEAKRVAQEQADAAKAQADADKERAKGMEDRLAEIEKRERELAERESALASASAPQSPVIQVVPGQNFNLQNALQQDANARARQLRTNEVEGGPVFRVPVTDPMTGQVAGWKMVNGKGERVDEKDAKKD